LKTTSRISALKKFADEEMLKFYQDLVRNHRIDEPNHEFKKDHNEHKLNYHGPQRSGMLPIASVITMNMPITIISPKSFGKVVDFYPSSMDQMH